MKKIFKYFVSHFWCLVILPTLVVCGCSCKSSPAGPAPNPLSGWNMDFSPQLNAVIDKDCQDYIKHLTPEEIGHSRISGYFNDGTGQHAVEIEVALNGTWWKHVLFYDKNNKRVKVVKYSPGHYRS